MAPKRTQASYKGTDKIRIAIYCHGLTAEPWRSEFTGNQRMEDVVSKMWTEALSKTVIEGSVELEEAQLYHIRDGVSYEPEETFVDRLGNHLKETALQPLQTLRVTRLMGLIPTPADNLVTHVYFVLSVPDESGNMILPGVESDENKPADDSKSVGGGMAPLETHVVRYAQNPAPSYIAQLQAYARRQGQDNAYYDGRYMYNHFKDTRAPPVSILHPSFALFLTRVDDTTTVLDENLIAHTFDFMLNSTAIYLKEQERDNILSALFTKIFRREVEVKQIKNARPDGALSFEVHIQPGGHYVSVPVLIVEYKVEPGAGGCDAGVQALSAIESFWLLPTKSVLRQRGCCPTFGVAMDGPWMRIYGCTLADDDRWIPQPLVSAVYTAIPSNLPTKHILSVCRVFQAFRDAIDDISRRTQQVASQPEQSHPIDTPSCAQPVAAEDAFDPFGNLRRPIMTPAPTECGNLVLQYEGVLDQHNLTYMARVISGWQELGLLSPRVVVKFTERYGEAAHRLLESQGFAPRLLYCGKPYASAFPKFTDMEMVVMEALPIVIPGPHDAEMSGVAKAPTAEGCRKVREAVGLLHQHGYVHGNITWKTVYISQTQGSLKVQLLNFDHAGKEGEVRYSLHPPQTPAHVKLPDGVGPMRLVKAAHDCYFLHNLFGEK